MFTDLNLLAVVVAALAYFLLGGLWYALLFARPWMKALNLEPDVRARLEKDFPLALASHFVSGILTAIVLGFFVVAVGATSVGAGAAVGFFAWLGFAFTIHFNCFMFERRPGVVFLVNTGFFIVAFIVMGGILAAWK